MINFSLLNAYETKTHINSSEYVSVIYRQYQHSMIFSYGAASERHPRLSGKESIENSQFI